MTTSIRFLSLTYTPTIGATCHRYGPAAGLLVEAFEAATMQLAGSTTSTANGSYSIPGLFPGNYQVKVNGDETYRTEFYDNAELLVDAVPRVL